MRSTFSRIFFPTLLLLLTALFLVGASFQLLVRNFLNRQALDNLENDGQAIAALASAYYTESTLTGKDFFINLSVATRVSDADAVLFDFTGQLLLCSDSPFGCEHRGWVISRDYVNQVLDNGIAKRKQCNCQRDRYCQRTDHLRQRHQCYGTLRGFHGFALPSGDVC